MSVWMFVIASLLSDLMQQISDNLLACPMYDEELFPEFPKWDHRKCPQIVKQQRSQSFINMLVVFISQSLGIVVHFIQHFVKKRKAREIQLQHIRGMNLNEEVPIVPKHSWKVYLYAGFPEALNFLLNIPSLLLQLYGSMNVIGLTSVLSISFVALFNKIILKRGYEKYQIVSVLLAIAAACIVFGLDAYIMADVPSSFAQIALGILFIAALECIYGLETVYEDMLLTSLNVSPLQLMGMEGIWGIILECVIVIPIQFGFKTFDSYSLKNYFYMSVDRQEIAVCTALSVVFQFFLGWGLFATLRDAKCVFRSMFEQSTVLLSDFLSFLIYSVSKQPPVYSYQWDSTSWLEFASYLLYLLAMLLHEGTIEFPFKRLQSDIDERVSMMSNQELQE